MLRCRRGHRHPLPLLTAAGCVGGGGTAELGSHARRCLAKRGRAFRGAGVPDVLPEAAQTYIQTVEQLLGVPVSSVGVGPDREASIERRA